MQFHCSLIPGFHWLPPILGPAHSRCSLEAKPSSQGVPVRDDDLHGIHAVKINMNSSGPSLRGSQGEAGSPACVCSGQEQKFPCEVAPPPPTPPLPFWSQLGWEAGVGRGPGLQPGELSCLSNPASLQPSPIPTPPLPQAKAGEGPPNQVPQGQEAWIAVGFWAGRGGPGHSVPGLGSRDTERGSHPVIPAASAFTHSHPFHHPPPCPEPLRLRISGAAEKWASRTWQNQHRNPGPS